jgi:hypothetical protein
MKNKEILQEENDGVQWASASNEANARNKLALSNKPIYIIRLTSKIVDAKSLTTEYYISSKYEENLNYVSIYGFRFINWDIETASKDAKTKNKKSNKIDITKSNWYIDLAWEDITKIATENGIKEQNLKIPWSEIKEVEILKAKIKNKE